MKTQKLFFTLLCSLSVLLSASAKSEDKTIEDTRTYHKSFEVNADASFLLNSRESDVNISTWSKNTVDVKVTITVEAFDQEDMEKAFKAFQVSIKGSPESVSVQGVNKIKNFTSFGNKMRIRTDDDNFKIKSYHYHYEVMLPETNHLDVKNRFGKVALGHHMGDITLDLYESTVMAQAIEATNGRITLKFGKGSLGSIRKTTIESYEGTIDMKAVQELNLNVKFSKFSLEKGGDAVITAYESSLTLPDMKDVSIEHSFGSIKMGNGNKILLKKQYEQTFEAGNLKELTSASSKFSKINVSDVNKISLGEAYETKIKLNQADNFTASAKFCTITLGQLHSNYTLEGYETTTHIDKVATSFKTINIKGKFSHNTITFSPQAAFRISADMDFSSLNYPEGSITRNAYEKKGSNGFKMTGTKGANPSSTITLCGYQMTTNLNL